MKLNGDGFSINIWHDIDNAKDIELHIYCGGKKYFCWVFTLEEIEVLMQKDSVTGECSNGAYFRVDGLMIVKSISEEILMQSISDLVKSNKGCLDSIFPAV